MPPSRSSSSPSAQKYLLRMRLCSCTMLPCSSFTSPSTRFLQSTISRVPQVSLMYLWSARPEISSLRWQKPALTVMDLAGLMGVLAFFQLPTVQTLSAFSRKLSWMSMNSSQRMVAMRRMFLKMVSGLPWQSRKTGSLLGWRRMLKRRIFMKTRERRAECSRWLSALTYPCAGEMQSRLSSSGVNISQEEAQLPCLQVWQSSSLKNSRLAMVRTHLSRQPSSSSMSCLRCRCFSRRSSGSSFSAAQSKLPCAISARKNGCECSTRNSFSCSSFSFASSRTKLWKYPSRFRRMRSLNFRRQMVKRTAWTARLKVRQAARRAWRAKAGLRLVQILPMGGSLTSSQRQWRSWSRRLDLPRRILSMTGSSSEMSRMRGGSYEGFLLLILQIFVFLRVVRKTSGFCHTGWAGWSSQWPSSVFRLSSASSCSTYVWQGVVSASSWRSRCLWRLRLYSSSCSSSLMSWRSGRRRLLSALESWRERRLQMEVFLEVVGVASLYLSLSGSSEGCGDRYSSLATLSSSMRPSDCSRLTRNMGSQRDRPSITQQNSLLYYRRHASRPRATVRRYLKQELMDSIINIDRCSDSSPRRPTPRNASIDKFYRLIFSYDGSVSRLIESLSGEQLIVRQLHHEATTAQAVAADQVLSEGLALKEEVEVRYVELRTPKLGPMVFAKSYWSKAAYERIMAKNPERAIGFNLIEQEVEQFRSINWVGEAALKLANDFPLMGLSRSYTIKSGGEVICEVEEFFTPHFNKLFY